MVEWLKSVYPELKVLFTSGYNDKAVSRQGGKDGGSDFLPKPYTLSVLTRKVREILDAA
jgi:FixJ family two-component response regulator